MPIGFSEHKSITDGLSSIIKEVEGYKEQVGRGEGGQELAVLHTELRKCLYWAKEMPAVQDEVDKFQDS